MTISKWITVGFALLALVITIPSYRNHIFFLNFVDEDDNIVIGNYVKEGKKLYADVFSQHQPSMFLISSEFQKIVKTDNIVMTVKRHREFMIIWSILWVLILSFRFGWPILIASSIIELSKISLLGNLFLAEGLVVYPLIYLIAYLFEKKRVGVKQISWENWVIATIYWLLWYSLTPLWPLLIINLLLLYFRSENKKLFCFTVSVIGLLSTIYITRFAGVKDYFYDALYINYKYYIPLTTPLGFGDSIVKAFLAPIYALFTRGTSELLILIKALSLGLITNILYLLFDKKYFKAGIIVVILGLTSLRYISPENSLYGAFHMLPWFSLLVLFNFLYLTQFNSLSVYRKVILAFIFIGILLSTINVARINLWDHRDLQADAYIHYSPQEDIREVVKILSKDENQTIWVEPVMYYPHWQTGAISYSTMVNYYGWMDQTPPMKYEIDTKFNQELPTIVWASTSLGIGNYLGSYVQFMRDDKPTSLYLRKDKVEDISTEVRQQLDYYRFQIN